MLQRNPDSSVRRAFDENPKRSKKTRGKIKNYLGANSALLLLFFYSHTASKSSDMAPQMGFLQISLSCARLTHSLVLMLMFLKSLSVVLSQVCFCPPRGFLTLL